MSRAETDRTGPVLLPVTEFHDAATIRLIPTAYINEPALAPLVDDVGDLDILNRLDALTSARINPASMPDGIDPAELLNASSGYGWTYVNAAFCHTRPEGNRFNGEERGAWYAAFGSDAAETCRAEVVFHRTRVLAEAGCFEDVGSYRELIAGFTCVFHDLREELGHPALNPDPAIAYPAGQALARSVMAAGGNGILYPSARYSSGQCLAAFRPSIIQNIRQGQTVTFQWRGKPDPEIVVEA